MTEVTGVPATLANTKTAVVSFKMTDVFGNLITLDTELAISTGTVRTGGYGAVTRDAAAGVYKVTLTSSSDKAFVASVDMGAAAHSGALLGFAAPADSFLSVVNSAGVSEQITLLTAQLAALQIIKDRKVSKLKYNRLARKWNAAFPSQKVWVKP